MFDIPDAQLFGMFILIVVNFVIKFTTLLCITGVVFFMIFGIPLKHLALYQYSIFLMAFFMLVGTSYPVLLEVPRPSVPLETSCIQQANDCAKLFTKYLLTTEEQGTYNEAVHYYCLERLDCQKGKEYICQVESPNFTGSEQVKAFKHKHRAFKCEQWNIPVTHVGGNMSST